jgi:ATP-binding cassette subfamily F protein uup
MPLVVLDQISHAYGYLPLLNKAALQVEPGECIAIIGRNGTGKSTLMQIIGGELPPDGGTVWTQPGARIARLVQDVPLSANLPVFDVIAQGLGDLGELIANYHHAAVEVATDYSEEAMTRLGNYQHELEERDGWSLEQRVELIVTKLDLPSEAIVDTLSGGWKRRVLLARALVSQPDVLLLDEPTNHLDIDSQEVLQTVLANFAGTVLLVSHDRYLVDALATQIWEARPSKFMAFEGSYQEFLVARNKLIEAEKLAASAASAKTTVSSNGKTSAESETKKKHGLNPYQLKQRITQVEDQIHALEAEVARLEAAIGEASVQGDSDRVSALGEAYTRAEADLHSAMEDWEMLLE